MNNQDYYEVLGVGQNADRQTIKEAYRKLAFQFHPDRNTGDSASVEKMKEINEAYAVLSDEEKRRRYDSLHEQYGSHAYDHFRQTYSEQDIFRGSDINQIFEEMAKAFGFRGFDDVFRGSYGQVFHTREFRGPNMFGRVIVFGTGQNRTANRRSPKEGPSLLEKAVSRVARYAVKKIVGRIVGAQDVAYDTVTIDEGEASHGTKIAYLDEKRSRQLNITIPPGVKEGQIIRLKAVESARDRDEDLYLKIEIRRPFLKRVKELLTK